MASGGILARADAPTTGRAFFDGGYVMLGLSGQYADEALNSLARTESDKLRTGEGAQ